MKREMMSEEVLHGMMRNAMVWAVAGMEATWDEADALPDNVVRLCGRRANVSCHGCNMWSECRDYVAKGMQAK